MGLFTQSVGDQGLTVEAVNCVEGFVAGLLLGGDGGIELTDGDLFGGGVDEAELAGREVDLAIVAGSAHGRAEGAAEDGPMFVEVAGAGGEVEDGTRLVVGELLEEDGSLVVFAKNAGGEIAGEPWVEAGESIGYSCVDACGSLRVCCFEDGKAFTEAGCVFVGDGEDADAALGAAGVADEMISTPTVGVGYGCVYDLDERLRHLVFVEGFALLRECPHLRIEIWGTRSIYCLTSVSMGCLRG
jgi:hypothetical protein